MLIANRLRDHNRAEYLLYMWQVEDILRANGCDLDRLRENYLCQFQLTGDARQELEQWYADLCEMMRSEDKMQSGHLQINLNVVETLAELHESLIRSDKFPYYRQLYYKVLPFIVELRAKNGTQAHTGIREELNLCFELLYGVLMLCLQKKEISTPTLQAAEEVSKFLGQLSDYWKAQKAGQLDLDKP